MSGKVFSIHPEGSPVDKMVGLADFFGFDEAASFC
jgi:hypothetical protein